MPLRLSLSREPRPPATAVRAPEPVVTVDMPAEQRLSLSLLGGRAGS